MGISSSLFYYTSNSENTLYWRIKPNDEQRENQMDRWNDLCEHLKVDLNERSNLAISSWLQGSYKFATQVRPARRNQEFDIDLGIYFRWTGFPNDGAFGPKELKDFVQASCLAYAGDASNDATSVAEPKARCVRVHFEGEFHIDVPCYHLDINRDARALATEDDQWEDSDPKAIYKWWKEKTSEIDRALVRRIVRYLKIWALLQFSEEDFSPSSILLTVLVIDAFDDIGFVAEDGDDTLLSDIVSNIYDRLEASARVGNPVNVTENLNRLSDTQNEKLLDKLATLIDVCDRALHASDSVSSAYIWEEVFEHFFPIPINEQEVLVETARSQAVSVMRFDPQIRVTAQIGPRSISKLNSIGPIPKGSSLDFQIMNADRLPIGSIVEWTVRNSGREAENENDLGHPAGKGISATEGTSYKGTHYMDVCVKLGGNVIGRRRIEVVVSGLCYPARNKPRPSWTNLR